VRISTNITTSQFVIGVMAMQAIFLGWSSIVHTPTHLEIFHFASGMSHWERSQYDLYRVNPPLIRTCAALPSFILDEPTDYGRYNQDPHDHAEYIVGLDTMHANGSRFIWLVTLGRWMGIPFVLLGSYICFLWARELYGDWAGIVALLLWAFCPYVLGHGSAITPDAHAAGLGVCVSYLFWQWLKTPSWKRASWLGVVLGIAELSKFTLLIFYPLWPILWIVYRLSHSSGRSLRRVLREGGMLATCFAVSVVVINCGYEFEGSFKRLGDYRFRTCVLNGADSLDHIPDEGGNRLGDTWLVGIPVPLPSNYVYGLDMQKLDFEIGVPSYLRGTWQKGGWWYFHLYALAVKLPLGTMSLILLTCGLSIFARRYNALWQDEMLLLSPVVVLFAILSWNWGIGLHSRYAIPLLPFVLIWCGKLGRVFREGRLALCGVVSVCVLWSIASSLCCFPHCLGYFNELVGGPTNGFRHLAKSDCSWGQDLLFLRRWMDRHPEAERWQIAHCGPFDPRIAGCEFTLPPVGPRGKNHPQTIADEELGPKPGWYAIDVCFLLGGEPLSAADGKGDWDEPSKTPGYDLSYFLHFEPKAMAGYSICIYHITLDEANRVRRGLGLPELSEV
jgi:hypothetical protein